MVCRHWQKGCWISVIYILSQHTFCRLWTGNCLLEKYYIGLPRILQFFWVKFGCVWCLVQLNFFFFTFCVFILRSVYTCKYMSRVRIHQLLVSPPLGSSNSDNKKPCRAKAVSGILTNLLKPELDIIKWSNLNKN